MARCANDLSPSHWSHAALLLPGEEKDLAAAPLYEIRLDPPSGFGFPAPTNGLQMGKVGDYRESGDYPNIAVARLPVEVKTVKEQLDRFKKQRAVLDAPDLIVSWLAFVWGAGRAGQSTLRWTGYSVSRPGRSGHQCGGL